MGRSNRVTPWIGLALIALAVLIGLLSGRAQGLSVNLSWKVPAGTNSIAGYSIYWGPSPRIYTRHLWAGPALSCTVTNLSGTNYFAATATDTRGLESDYSCEVRWPRLSSPTNQVLTITGAGLEWCPSPAGPWAATAPTTLTNPAARSAFWRGAGAIIQRRWQ